MTLSSLARIVGASKSYIWELENKSVPRASGEKLAAIAKALDTTIDYLLGSEDEIDQTTVQDKAFYLTYLRLAPKDKSVLRMLARSFDDSLD